MLESEGGATMQVLGMVELRRTQAHPRGSGWSHSTVLVENAIELR